MINNDFWKAAASSWSWEAKADISVTTGSGGQISSEFLKKPWEVVTADDELIDFEKVDYEATMKSMNVGGAVILDEPVAEDNVLEANMDIAIDMALFDSYFEKETLYGFAECFKMLRDCGLPEEVTEKLKEIVMRMGVLNEATDKFKAVYEADMSVFMDNYIPESLNLSVSYIEYVNANVKEDILLSTQNEVIDALGSLLIGINDKIDEIYRFASVQLKAKAKALESLMSQDGFIDAKYKITE